MTGRNDFSDYADYYDTIYSAKDYRTETAWIVRQVTAMGAVEGKWLDVGCGTGRHLEHIPSDRYKRYGVDRSEKMIAKARVLVPDARIECAEASTLPFDGPFQVVSAIFAVASYLAEPGEFDTFLKECSHRMSPGGVIYFDAWYGPGVLHDGPVPREASYPVDGGTLVRSSTPTHEPLLHRVTVRYRLELAKGEQAPVLVSEEAHRMRYYFPFELQESLERNGFVMRRLCPFGDESRDPNNEDWNIAVLGVKV